MPVVLTSPGVYVEEIPSGVRTITGVATSVTGFVGRTLRGSVEEPIPCPSWADFERRCGGLWKDSELGYAVYQFFLNGGSQAVVARVPAGATSASTTLAGSVGGNLGLEVANPGTWGANLRVSVDHGIAGSVSETADNDTFHLELREVDPVLEALATTEPEHEQAIRSRELFPHVSVDPASPRYVEGVVGQGSSLARVTSVPEGRPAVTTRQAFTGGDDGSVADAERDYPDAIERLERADVINLLCVPPVDRNTPTTIATWTEALDWCERHRAVLLVDPSSGWADAQAAADLAGGFDTLRSPNSAFYFPRILGADPLQQNLPRPFAPSRRGRRRVGPHRRRAGRLEGAGRHRGHPDRGDRARASAHRGRQRHRSTRRGVNALRALPVVGPVVWGARTGRGADAGLGVEVPAGATARPVHRGVPGPRHPVGGVRAQRRTAVGRSCGCRSARS